MDLLSLSKNKLFPLNLPKIKSDTKTTSIINNTGRHRTNSHRNKCKYDHQAK